MPYASSSPSEPLILNLIESSVTEDIDQALSEHQKVAESYCPDSQTSNYHRVAGDGTSETFKSTRSGWLANVDDSEITDT
jgi:hypothetical protein